MFEFAWPYLFILLPLPYIFYRWYPPARQPVNQALQIPQAAALFQYAGKRPSGTGNASRRHVLLFSVIWLLLLLSAARPQWLAEPIKLPVSGRDLILAVDLSGSMDLEDMQIDKQMVNRLTAVKQVLAEFIPQRKGDRLGLILFADHAYLQTPLTYDSVTVAKMLQESEIGLAGKKTAIGEAIGLAIKRIKDLPAHEQDSRVMILLTDGANTAGIAPLEVARLAAQLKIKIYTIGVGADELIVRTVFGRQRVNPSQDLDEKTLSSIAEMTGGKYFRARDTQALQEIYQLLNQLEPIESDQQSYRPIDELFHWPLALALLLSFMYALYHIRLHR